MLTRMLSLGFAMTIVLAGSAAGAATPAPMTMPTGAMPTCKGSTPVVWADPKNKVFYMKGSAMYGKAAHGLYLCENAAVTAGDRAAKDAAGIVPATGTGMTSHSALASPMPSNPSSLETNQMPNTSSSSSPSP